MMEDTAHLGDTLGNICLDGPSHQHQPQQTMRHPNHVVVSFSQEEPPTTSSNNKPLKQVRFGYVTIRNYDITMGDNPSVTAGPPIQLDWVYEEIPVLPVREFEQFKLQRMTKHSYLLPGSENRVVTISPDFRTGILLRAGFTDWEISQTVRNVKKIQQQRVRTAMTYPFYHVEYAVRSAGRKIQRSMGSTSNGQNSGTASRHMHRFTSKSRHQYHDDEMTTGTVVDDNSVYEESAATQNNPLYL